MKGTSVCVKIIMELNTFVILRFAILLWLSGCKNFSRPSRNRPQDPCVGNTHFTLTVPFLVQETCWDVLTKMLAGREGRDSDS